MEWTTDQRARRTAAEAGRAVVANLRTDRALIMWARADGRFVYIGRRQPRLRLPESAWANRAVIVRRGASDAERVDAIAAYERGLLLCTDLLTDLLSLRGRVLGCWCNPKACHGDVIARLVNGAEIKHELFSLASQEFRIEG